MNAEKAASPILKIREYIRIFEFFNEKYGNPGLFKKDKEKITRDIIKKFTDKNVSANIIKNWWRIDDKCSHGGIGGRVYITSLNTKGLKEVKGVIIEIRCYARLLIEGIARRNDFYKT